MPAWLIATIIMVGLVAMLFTGLPIAFCLIGVSAILLVVFLGPSGLYVVVGSTFAQIGTEVFIACPLFVLMASILQFSGIIKDLYEMMHRWTPSFLRGGIAVGTMLISTLIAAMSGIVATASVSMGLMAYPEMIRRGYNKRLALGTIMAGGMLGPLIPPSILMIIVGGYSQVSVGKLFMGGVLSGLLMSFLFCLYIVILCYRRKEYGPAVSDEEKITWQEKFLSLRAVFLPILIVIAVLGSIYGGIATPTEAASVGVAGTVLCSLIHRTFSWSRMKEALYTTMRVTSMVLWLLFGGGCYSMLLTASGTSAFISDLLIGLPAGSTGILIAMMVIVLIMGCLVDPIAICMVTLPVFVPVAMSLGLDMVYVTLLLTIAMLIGYITPPFGVSLFYMKGVTPEDVPMMDIYRGAIPFALIAILCLAVCVAFPPILIWLPKLMID